MPKPKPSQQPKRVLVAARLSTLVRDKEGKTDKGSIQSGLDTQEIGVLDWAASKGYEVVGVAADFKTGKSNLWDRPKLRPWVTDPEYLVRYDAIACLKVDRLTRADDEGVAAMEKWARDNSKELLISSAEVHFPSEGAEGAMWDMYIRMAHQEWLGIQERYKRMQEFKHGQNSLIGRAPWGYEVVTLPGGIKTLEPTLDGRVWVPRIFGWLAEGKTPRWVGAELERNGVRASAADGRWHESVLIKMAKRTTYTGMRAREGRSALEVEALVSNALADEAIAQIGSRARHGRDASSLPKVLLSNLKHGDPECPGEGSWPMYRTGGRYYRCAGKGAQRKGCGLPMVPCADLDALVLGASEYWDAQPYVSQVYITGNDTGAEVAQLRAQMADAIRVADLDAIPGIAAEYGERIKALEAQGSIQPHWEDRETGQTEGEHLRSLDLDGQRDWLARKDILAWMGADGAVNVTINGALARKGGRTVIGEIIAEG